MAEETIQIIRIETGEAVKSVNDLRENVKILKERLGDLAIGTEEYQDTLEELKVNQNAVKDAMYATTSSMEDLAESATGTSNSYNSLVHRMAALKEELRATDVSTQQGKERFKELAGQINEVNNTLKEMDALQGNFQRNVGNYPGLMKNFSGSIDALDKGIKATSGDLGKLKNGFDALAVNPAFAILGIVVALFGSLTDNLKENETTMQAVNKAGVSLEPVFKLLKGILDKVAVVVADLIGKASEFIQSNGIIPRLIDGVVGIGNAIVKFVVAPFKGVIAAIKVFKEEGVRGLGDASKAFAAEMKSGVAFKANFEAGHTIVENIISGVQDRKETAKAEAMKVGEEVGEAYSLGFLNGVDKAIAENERRFEEMLKRKQEEQAELDRMTQEMLDETNAEIDAYFAEEARQQEESKRKAEEVAKAKIAAMQSVVGATASLFDTLATLYEQDAEHSAKSAKKAKALRIATATIDTISGAVGAFATAAANPGGIPGMIIGAINAAAVTATGIAQIAKIKATNIGSSTSSPSVPAVASAPTTASSIPNVRSVTSASEEERLNQMASDQRVVLVMSDLEVKQEQQRVQMAEASF